MKRTSRPMPEESAGITFPLAGNVVVKDKAQGLYFRGREAALSLYSAFLVEGYSQATVDIGRISAEDGVVLLALTFRGRHDGPFLGIPPTRQTVVLAMTLSLHTHNGCIVRAVLDYDSGDLLRQLGIGL